MRFHAGALVVALCAFGDTSVAQEEKEKAGPPRDFVVLGIGMGLDHGGFGARCELLPEDHASVFLGLGYAYAGVGWNAGVIARVLPRRRVCPYAIAMYGYNAAVISTDRKHREFFSGHHLA